MQNSGIKILSFLINDMLDFAQISAGKFRKFVQRFDVVESIKEIVNVM